VTTRTAPGTTTAGVVTAGVVEAPADHPRESWDDPVRGRLAWSLLLEGAGWTGDGSAAVGLADLGTDGWLGLHRHAAPELYHVVAGRVVVTVDGDEQEAGPGDVVALPADAEHGIRAVGTEPARFLFVFPHDHYADVVYRFSAGDAAQHERRA
jgi:mannose-6-phosphate isomerase-like protein (cupin superfamily)